MYFIIWNTQYFQNFAKFANIDDTKTDESEDEEEVMDKNLQEMEIDAQSICNYLETQSMNFRYEIQYIYLHDFD